ncbi:fibronectin type III domain-containing protein [Priestia megaterium]|uniref:fibronectin type III domain-containing protein n=1 Tax=Priestia megaterium TaxID=1404 RepID=UPI000BF4245C|nr:fibronectin type III domain-containing protein [Priestia megaterium]PFT49234.1 hypothetical protein COK68_29185 [Priestia megaterium]
MKKDERCLTNKYKKRFKKRYFIIPALCSGFLLGGEGASAAEKPLVSVEKSDKVVTLQINESGDRYEIYQDGKLEYSGKSNKYQDNLNSDIQNYKVGVFKQNKLKKVSTVKVTNNKKSNMSMQKSLAKVSAAETNTSNKDKKAAIMEENINTANLEVVATNDSVTLNWDKTPDENGVYEIYKDDVQIGSTRGLEFTDKNVKPNSRYQYDIVATTQVSDEQKEKYLNLAKERKIKLTAKDKKELFSIEGHLSNIIDIPNIQESSLEKPQVFIKEEENNSASSKTSMKAAYMPKANAYSFLYMTFIPYFSLEDPVPLNGTYLKGDDRGFYPYSNRYRTKVDVSTGFKGPTYINPVIDIGTSHRCADAACKKVIETKTASKSGIKVYKDQVSTRKMVWRVKHDVGIPFGKGYPNINYYYEATLLSSPSFVVKGAHDKAPNHEFYLFAETSTKAFPIEKYKVNSTLDFMLLAPGTPQHFFNRSF